MKSVFLSIQPKWCELIASGKKTVEVRKTRPKIETPFKVYIYETKGKTENPWIDEEGHIIYEGRGQVIGEFICDEIVPISVYYSNPNSKIALKEFPFVCLTDKQIIDYLGNGKGGYGWKIANLSIYSKPKELDEFNVIDEIKLKKCPFRDRVYNNPEYTNGALLKGGYVCNRTGDWCEKCIMKPITRPPQSWCYVEEANK